MVPWLFFKVTARGDAETLWLDANQTPGVRGGRRVV